MNKKKSRISRIRKKVVDFIKCCPRDKQDITYSYLSSLEYI